jgi:hypothetical protein
VTLDGQGGFTMKEFVYSSGSVKTVNAIGTYTINPDCTIVLTFTSSDNGGGTGANAVPPPNTFKGLLVDNQTGFVSVRPNGQSPVTFVTGALVSQ